MSGSPALDQVLSPGGLTAVFQPVFEIGGRAPRVHFLEGLIRGPGGTNLEEASTLFEYVRRKRQEAVVDGACVAVILKAAAALPGEFDLSLNVHAVTLARDVDFVARLAFAAQAHGIDTSRLIVEIIEHAPSWAGTSLEPALRLLRRMDVRIALDDVGLGRSNYAMMLNVHPQYFKLDRHLVHGCHADPYRRAVVESVVQLAGKVKARVIAEGAEVVAEVDALGDMGVDLAQGWFFSPALTAWEVAARGHFSAAAPASGLPAGGQTRLRGQ